MRTVANRTERERIIAKMIEKNCPHCGAAMPEEAHYCLQCMTPLYPGTAQYRLFEILRRT